MNIPSFSSGFNVVTPGTVLPNCWHGDRPAPWDPDVPGTGDKNHQPLGFNDVQLI